MSKLGFFLTWSCNIAVTKTFALEFGPEGEDQITLHHSIVMQHVISYSM